MDIKSLLKTCKISRVENAAAAGQTDLTTDVLDMSGYDSVCFVALLGDVDNTSALELQVFKNNTNDTVTPTEITDDDVTYTAAAADADNKMLIADVHRPSERYVYAVLKRGTANAVVDGIIAIQYNAKDLPVSQGSTVLASAFLQAG